MSAVAEAFIVLLPYFFLPHRLKPLLWVPIILLHILTLVILLYFRSTGILLTADLLSLGLSMDTQTIDTGLATLTYRDWSIAFLFILEGVVYFFTRHSVSNHKYTLKARLISISWAFGLGLFAMAMKLNMFERVNTFKPETISNFAKFLKMDHEVYMLGMANPYMWWGQTYYFIDSAIDALTLEENDIQTDRKIAEAIANISSSATLPPAITADIADEPKNLILIIVESMVLPSATNTRGLGIHSTLDSLMNDSTVITIPDMQMLAMAGRSAAGQFIYNTGLITPRRVNFVTKHSVADYPSIAKALGSRRTVEYIAESPKVWRHQNTTVSYGYKELYSNEISISINDKRSGACDTIVFATALEDLSRRERPFFAQIATASMHEPYEHLLIDPPGLDYQRLSDMGFTWTEYVYLERLHLTDSAIKSFIDGLKISDLYDSSVIVIVADHHPSCIPPTRAFGEMVSPVFILNSGMHRLPRRRDFAQSDIFPTLLDLMRIKDYRHPILKDIATEAGDSLIDKPYRGLGRSLFDMSERPDTSMLRDIGTQAVVGRTFRFRRP